MNTPVEPHFTIPDNAFEAHFANATFTPEWFSHEAHLRLAWIHLSKYGLKKATENICKQIEEFDKVHGSGTKFHMTLTVAAVNAVWHFYQKSDTESFWGFIQENPRLKHNFKDLMSAHYSWDLVGDPVAKAEYVEPDLAPFV